MALLKRWRDFRLSSYTNLRLVEVHNSYVTPLFRNPFTPTCHLLSSTYCWHIWWTPRKGFVGACSMREDFAFPLPTQPKAAPVSKGHFGLDFQYDIVVGFYVVLIMIVNNDMRAVAGRKSLFIWWQEMFFFLFSLITGSILFASLSSLNLKAKLTARPLRPIKPTLLTYVISCILWKNFVPPAISWKSQKLRRCSVPSLVWNDFLSSFSCLCVWVLIIFQQVERLTGPFMRSCLFRVRNTFKGFDTPCKVFEI